MNFDAEADQCAHHRINQKISQEMDGQYFCHFPGGGRFRDRKTGGEPQNQSQDRIDWVTHYIHDQKGERDEKTCEAGSQKPRPHVFYKETEAQNYGQED